MRWKSPQDNEQRTRRIFAFFPVQTNDGFWVWLEIVEIEEYFCTYDRRWIRMGAKRLKT